MESFVASLQARLEAALEEIGKESNAILRYDRSVKQVRDCIDELKHYIHGNPFPTKMAEISYFKEFAPIFYSQIFFFLKVHQLELSRQYSNSEALEGKLEKELQAIDLFNYQHWEICKYYYTQATYCDDLFFTLAGRQKWQFDEICAILDTDLTLGSYLISWIKANVLFRDWLDGELFKMNHPEEGAALSNGLKLKWTASQTDLVELINALHVAGSFNEGKVDLKKVVRWFEMSLGIDLGHFYTTYQQIARRKKERTKFLDLIREGLVRKMEETD